MPTRKPVAVVGKVCEQCFIIFMTTYDAFSLRCDFYELIGDLPAPRPERSSAEFPF